MRLKEAKKPFNNANSSADITGIIEILMPLFLWERMKNIKNVNPRLTYSWISRYALFRLLRHANHKNFLQNAKFRKLQKQERAFSKNRKKCHRHSLCFYGEDEEVIRQLSLQLRIDVSTLVRIALLLYLKELECGKIPNSTEESSKKKYARISHEKIIAFGTKIVKKKNVKIKSLYFVAIKTLKHSFLFEEDDFWWNGIRDEYPDP